jgi:2-polyprenyl-6-methoxyphenol hydroxylase-like FAD-dependent oxidoreductase
MASSAAMDAPLDIPKPDRGHAVVIGGSMAGLLAARVLSDHFERVTVIDRDQIPDDAAYRSGVPQGRHLHFLLLRGRQILDALFPDLESDYRAAGVPLINLAEDLEIVTWAGPLPRYRSQFEARSSTRAWLESVLRKRLKRRASIEFRTQSEALGLSANARKTVTGVHVWQGKTRQTIHADLIVDASGRNSKAIDWLDTLGFGKPSITTINGFLGYATRWYERPPGVEHGWKGILTGSLPTSNPRSGVLFPTEGDRWVLTLAGLAHQYPPTDDAGFLDFARQLISPRIYETVRTLTPVSPIYGYRRTENRWVHFEQLKRWPDHFIVLGDAACCFNPVYGQGMAVSAVEAMLLDGMLRSHGPSLNGFAQRFQRALPSTFKPAWLLSTGEDFRWPTTEGGKPDAATRFAHKYIDRLFDIMPSSPAVFETFMVVQHLLAPPALLFHPSLMARVLARSARRLVEPRSFAAARERSRV